LNKETSFLPVAGSRQSVEAKATATGNENGLVRSVVTYTVMDDLKVAPMSTISGITLLNTFGITDISMLDEKTVQIGYEEVIIYSYTQILLSRTAAIIKLLLTSVKNSCALSINDLLHTSRSKKKTSARMDRCFAGLGSAPVVAVEDGAH
jgi:hypothetical protein